MNRLRIIRLMATSTLLLGCCLSADADAFDDYIKKKDQEWNRTIKRYNDQHEAKVAEYNTTFENKRAEYNTRFVEYLAKPWREFELNRHKKAPTTPTPDVIIPADKTEPIKTIQIKEKLGIIELPKNEDVDLTIREISQRASHVVNYYGSNLKVELTKEYATRFKVQGVSEKAVSKAMSYLIDDTQFKTLVDNCVALKSQYNMCDWGYIMFTDKLAKSYFGEEKCSESILLRAFLLTQTGYDVRVGKSEGGLELLVHSDDEIFEFLYVNFLDDSYERRYYLITAKNVETINTYKERYSEKSRPCELKISTPQMFAISPSQNREYRSRKGVSVGAYVNQNLMDFYDDYPPCSWTVYAVSGMSQELYKQVVGELKLQILGLDKKNAVSKILNFVQTAFPYAKDSSQFNGERPLFPDEVFYYPGCDCEDHAILFAYLVNELVGLDVIFLHYREPFPHLSTAIKFDDERILGDAILYEGEKYIMCDPTIGGSGADIGVQARECKNLVPICYKIKF